MSCVPSLISMLECFESTCGTSLYFIDSVVSDSRLLLE